MISSKPDYLPEASAPKTSTLGVRAPIEEFLGGTNIRSLTQEIIGPEAAWGWSDNAVCALSGEGDRQHQLREVAMTGWKQAHLPRPQWVLLEAEHYTQETIYLFICSSFEQLFIEFLLCARTLWGTGIQWCTTQEAVLIPLGAYVLVQKDKQWESK